MTQRFPWSRLTEIAQAPPVDPVSFPRREEVALLKRTLQTIRQVLRLRADAPGRAAEPGPCRPHGS